MSRQYRFQTITSKATLFALLAALLLLSSGCASASGRASYLDPRADKGSAEWGPYEIKQTVDTMVESLYDHLKESRRPALLSVDRIRNRTSEHIDTQMISNELSTMLMQQKIAFVDRSMRKEAIDEMIFGQSGLVDESAIPIGNLKSPNYLLTGDVSESLRYVSGRRVQYLVVTLRLVSMETTMVAWQAQQEFLKSSRQDRISW